ncbi:MAG: rhamnosyltransferase [Shewanella psychromarinicola]|uniref:glycosyltransferase family 2 protein n=1 Tax=Shewanella psychromarinicola TaxID=2487742 RepID=UPI003EEEB542
MIGAAVILFKPDSDITYDLIESVLAQVDVLCIIDNSPLPTILNIPKDKLHYHHFPNNIGVAAAHNMGIRDLRTSGCEYALLLDQDSQIDDDFAFRMSSLLVASKIKKRPLVAIGPRIICSFSEKSVKPRVQREISVYDNLVCVTQIISSGMMIDLSKIDLIGFKDETLFIDGVDHEWCWRAKTQDYMVAIAENIEMIHKLGDARSKFAGITYKVGTPIRLYYQFRNILLLSRRDYVPSYWKTRNILVLPIRFLANSLLQTQKRKRIKFMLCGLCDGLLKRDGAFHEHW